MFTGRVAPLQSTIVPSRRRKGDFFALKLVQMDAFKLLTTGTSLKKAASVSLAKKQEETRIQKIFYTGKVKVTGTNPIEPIKDFPECLFTQNLHEQGFKQASPIQQYAIPAIEQRRDVLACAPTGSGKTVAYLYPIVRSLQAHKDGGFRAVIVLPTRELAEQVNRQLKRLIARTDLKAIFYDKSNEKIQEKNTKLREIYDICVSTPMRLVHAIKSGLSLANVEFLVLDEADRLFEKNFVEQTDGVLSACTHPRICKCLFSATLPSTVEELAKTVAHDPLRIIVGQKDAATSTIEQKLLFVGNEASKLVIFRQMVSDGEIQPRVVIFVQDIDRAKALYTELMFDGIHVAAIHGELPQMKRDEVMARFRKGEVWVLIATDLLARGIDFNGVKLVINYDFPQSVHSYIHRIGRTGRAGHGGRAITFYTKEDSEYLKLVAGVMKSSGCEVPEWIMALPKPTKQLKKKLKYHAPDRKRITTRSSYDRHKEVRKKEAIQQAKKLASIKKQQEKKKEKVSESEMTTD
ncbi:ATP-dependent RNA helicase Rok1 [Schizosaccharomyces japonicus yFS275]|uniref:RNA helicase n=1 Tax=Schizosaccharomyces japonicus (strain yFS275 / FY16936) TaxID=402676 RepID=B6JX58_SCHJY|nr:ATP-dependent RNA helicase Rok1 [Schizosaccharomyces japonicus yFS275]EEB05959.1 ATP-dependent RNA helicase Rok1 [Schizosaccharomyces japonicus yFS275]